jgi:hypothetical protein
LADVGLPEFLPKLSFHLLGFLVTTAGSGVVCVVADTVETGGSGGTGGTGGRTAGPLAESKALGIPNIDGGSNGTFLDLLDSILQLLRPLFPLLMLSVWREEAIDVLLSSLARVCEAEAKVIRVSSLGAVGVPVEPLPLRAPLFRLLVVEVEREVMPSGVLSSWSGSGSSSSSASRLPNPGRQHE